MINFRRAWIATIAVSLSVIPALAQKTWNNLAFGSSRDEVRAELAKQNLQMEFCKPPLSGRCSEGAWVVEPDWELNISKTFTLRFEPRLWFSGDKKLKDIVLDLDGGQLGDEKQAADDANFKMAAVPEIKENLLRKYGTPISETDACKADSQTIINSQSRLQCKMIWKDGAQVIEFHWDYLYPLMPPAMLVSIEYSAPTGGGL